MKTVSLPVYDERRGRFAKLTGRNVFVYWPHGLGDWAHLGLILPFLEPSNRYTVSRYGDDYVALLDGNAYASPSYTGVRAISDGSDAGARHLDVNWKRINGRVRRIAIPRFEQEFERTGFDAVLYTDYPDRAGRTKFPFHTKARALVRDLVTVTPQVLRALDRPLASTISFSVDAALQAQVEARLRSYVQPGERFLLLGRGGHTNSLKDWDVQEADRLRALASAQTPRWRVIAFEDEFQVLFGDIDAPFALVLKALFRCADLMVGVPAGPLHVALGYNRIPVVGIWLAHHPDWYEERSESAMHLLGKPLFDARYDRRPANTSLPEHLRNRSVEFRTQPRITAADVWQAARELLR